MHRRAKERVFLQHRRIHLHLPAKIWCCSERQTERETERSGRLAEVEEKKNSHVHHEFMTFFFALLSTLILLLWKERHAHACAFSTLISWFLFLIKTGKILSLSPSDDKKSFFSSRSIRRAIQLELIEAEIFLLEDNNQNHLLFVLPCLPGRSSCNTLMWMCLSAWNWLFVKTERKRKNGKQQSFCSMQEHVNVESSNWGRIWERTTNVVPQSERERETEENFNYAHRHATLPLVTSWLFSLERRRQGRQKDFILVFLSTCKRYTFPRRAEPIDSMLSYLPCS